jgi:16S rRNA (cytosine1402-N4)-methyltransferase
MCLWWVAFLADESERTSHDRGASLRWKLVFFLDSSAGGVMPDFCESNSIISAGGEPTHVSVLLAEIVEWLQPEPGKVLVDGTLGAGGHTRALAQRVAPEGLIIALDRDPAALESAAPRLAGLPVKLVESNFAELPDVLAELKIPAVDGVVLDLGLSSDQLADRQRGFSFDSEGPLDLRFNASQGRPAWQLLERIGAEELANLIYEYGEERLSRRIARKIVDRRRQQPIRTAADLASIVRSCYPRSQGRPRIDPATRTFQALRIAINEELRSLESALKRIPDCLKPGGRLAVISFHSLEDRRVKEAFRDDPRLQALTRKPLRPTDEEVARNPRARSAKLRIAARRESC